MAKLHAVMPIKEYKYKFIFNANKFKHMLQYFW